ncbi:ATP-binding protein [Rhodoferax sp.]|uniref:ATP-binding protein n=1 Tax=Rhodoferax sp. TaxID=50421 RepID=UPI00374DF611
MAALRRLVTRCLPSSLFGRLALLLSVAVLASHVLALTMMFQFRPPMPDRRTDPPPPMLRPGAKPLIEFDNQLRPPPPPERGPPMVPGLWLDIGVRLAALVVAAWIGARWLSAPIRRLASAAKALGQDIDHPPLPEDGPLECRDASRLFNQMRSQIRQQLSDSDRFVAAVSHDLRTPLTRLRLRAEGLGDSAQKNAFRHDIVQMDEMITATLDYLRGAADEEAMVRLDMQALIECLADDQQACGHAVSFGGSAEPLMVQASALRRCLSNLVDNAIRYGGAAHIELVDSPEQLCIEVHDPGPGLPEDELSRVMAPFYRAEASSSRHLGGVGLGLSIALDIARRHQGLLQLRNSDGAGLVATVQLPRMPAQLAA